jgi:DNA-binding LytR/AlgR family response regulator
MDTTSAFIWVQIPGKRIKVYIHEILFCAIDDRSIKIFLYPKKEVHHTCHTLSQMERALPTGKFPQCSRQACVNIEYVTQYSPKKSELTLVNNEKLHVTKSHRKFFDDLFKPLGKKNAMIST